MDTNQMHGVEEPSSSGYIGCKFPNELLLLIKEFIPISDLRTHVCYYHTCRTVAGFYGNEGQQADFWRKSCLRAGICFTKVDTSYKEVAFETIVDDGFCAHPDCGGNLLASNARMIEEAMQNFNWDPEDDAYDIAAEAPQPEPVVNRIFTSLAFFGTTTDTSRHSSHRMPIYLRQQSSNPQERRMSLDRMRLSSHAVVRRSMATFPALHSMLFTLGHDLWVHFLYSNPITVLDVLVPMSQNLDEPLTVQKMLEMLRGPFGDLCPKNGAIALEDIEKYSTLRGLFARCSWNGLHMQGWDEDGLGPVFGLSFSPLSEELYQTERKEEDKLLALPPP